MIDFSDYLEVLDDSDFEEEPVDLTTFVTSKEFMNLPGGLSALQYEYVERMTMIYKQETYKQLGWGDENWYRRKFVKEIILCLGKGSGKDMCTTIAVCYIIYLLLCLKDPAEYYGRPTGDNIDILNVAINAQQATNVFFNPMVKRIKNSPWFDNKYESRAHEIIFDKGVRCFSGHSEREAWEGYNLLVAVLDEIAGFQHESTSGNEQAKTAWAIYEMYKASVDSRYPDYGKVICLSFPRFKGDFIMTRYAQVVGDKEIVKRRYSFKLNDDLPDGLKENEFQIEWEEDNIRAYTEPYVYALKRPTWEVNPLRSIEDYKVRFFRNPTDTLSRFACMPPEAVDAFFKQKEKVYAAFDLPNVPFADDNSFLPHFRPLETDYFVHVDLAYKHDRAALCMVHVAQWVELKYGVHRSTRPKIVMDLLKYWTPTPDKSVDFNEIKNFIFMLRSLGFNLKLITFDQWQSLGIQNELRAAGVAAEQLSVQKPQYEELALLFAEELVKGYYDEILIDELLGLQIIKGNKVDHPRKGSNDLADAFCGAVYNAAQNAKPEQASITVNILEKKKPELPPQAKRPRKAPGGPSKELKQYLARMRAI